MYMIPARGPQTRFKKHIWGNLGIQSEVVTGVRHVRLLRNDWNTGSGATGATFGLLYLDLLNYS